MTTWNPADKEAVVTLSGGNLTATLATNLTHGGVRSTTSKAAGKVVFEMTVTALSFANDIGIGLFLAGDAMTSAYPGDDGIGIGYSNDGDIGVEGANSGGASYANGAVIMVAADFDNLLVYFAKDGSWQNSADPGAGTGGISFSSNTWFAAWGGSRSGNSVAGTTNFGATAFTTTTPTGFVAWDAPETTWISQAIIY
jgi:hypothetical protein